ncbi:MAG: hypothetical protein ABI559_10055 [Chloroflexota bacterium]
MIAAVALVGFALAVVAAFAWNDEDILFLASIAIMTIVSEVVDLGPFGNSRISISIVLICTAGLFSGLPGAVIVALVSASADAVAHRKATKKVVFNAGVLVTTGAAYCGVTSLFASGVDSHDWTAHLGPSMAGAFAAYVVNSGFVTMAISMDNGIDAFTVWSSRFRWLLPYYIVIGLLAVMMALSYDRWAVGGLALFLLPLGMAWLAMKQYADGMVRTRTTTAATTTP